MVGKFTYNQIILFLCNGLISTLFLLIGVLISLQESEGFMLCIRCGIPIITRSQIIGFTKLAEIF